MKASPIELQNRMELLSLEYRTTPSLVEFIRVLCLVSVAVNWAFSLNIHLNVIQMSVVERKRAKRQVTF